MLQEFGFAPFQVVLLSVLCDREEITQWEVAQRASSDANTVKATLLLLERDGLLVRESHKEDRRGWVVAITVQGRRTQEEFSSVFKPLQDVLLSSLGVGRAEVLLADLHSLNEDMGRWEGR
ncbi:hypothetical protein Pla123a_11330 [Posidoniimonas polymericola]|uniref:HTH marR-type domain-containing protein n=1 Tax=Posidoniimonas polymericola TaxID=2528002 RepID=A0A5C5YTK6_9BACT|nr:MarR family winged helix-turn-helix transcriptional regulator [Posidoniimonas polymericola]TWT78342.1 hypothetical protein Pla123a_11330 [Posidoniimonas polymericola]